MKKINLIGLIALSMTAFALMGASRATPRTLPRPPHARTARHRPPPEKVRAAATAASKRRQRPRRHPRQHLLRPRRRPRLPHLFRRRTRPRLTHRRPATPATGATPKTCTAMARRQRPRPGKVRAAATAVRPQSHRQTQAPAVRRSLTGTTGGCFRASGDSRSFGCDVAAAPAATAACRRGSPHRSLRQPRRNGRQHRRDGSDRQVQGWNLLEVAAPIGHMFEPRRSRRVADGRRSVALVSAAISDSRHRAARGESTGNTPDLARNA